MHLVSTTNSLSKSEGNVAVAVFCYNERRKFLRVSDDYEDTIQRVCQAFDIDDDAVLSIHTSSLDACKGASVEIHESAYPLMWTVLDEINVFSGESIGAQRRGMKLSTPWLCASNRSRATSEPRRTAEASSALPTPRSTPPTDAVTRFDGNSEIKVGHVSPQRAKSPIIVVLAKDALEEHERSDYDEEEMQNEEEEQEVEMWHNAEEEERKKEKEAEKGKGKEVAHLAWNFQDKLAAREDGGSTPPTKFKPTRNLFTLVKNNAPLPEVKKEKVTEPFSEAMPRPNKSPKEPVALDADPRFEISILGPKPNQIAQFTTRGKHPVRKVLAAACKTFDIDYDRAHLYLGMVVEDDDGEMAMHEFECAVHETMTQCGVDTNSRLYVRVDRNEDDELDQSDE